MADGQSLQLDNRNSTFETSILSIMNPLKIQTSKEAMRQAYFRLEKAIRLSFQAIQKN